MGARTQTGQRENFVRLPRQTSLRTFAIGLALCLAASTAPTRCSGQDIDTLITSQTPRRTTVFDEAQSPREHSAILALYREKDAAVRATLAASFVETYPRSAFLTDVYQIAAKAEIALGNYTDALSYAEQALRLYPESELLLVSVADVQAQQGFYRQAESNASNALDDLNRFTSPASVSEAQWNRLKPQLEATCYFVLGRARMAEALGSRSAADRTKGMKETLDDLNRAASLNPGDDEVEYLAGLACLALADSSAAAGHFARAYRLKGPLESKALGQLQKLYSASVRQPQTPFDLYVKSIPDLPVQTQRNAPAERVDTAPELPDYAGSKTCQQCHPGVYESWSHTGMSKMFRAYAPENVIGDFKHRKVYYVGESDEWNDGQLTIIPAKARTPFARMVSDHGSDYFDIRDATGRWHRYRVDYTIGSKWEQGYATRLPNGEIHVFPIQYNRIQKRWVDFWQIIDPPGSPRADVTQWLKLDPLTSYQANCAVCHTSQLRNVNGGGFVPQGLEFREPGIDCEMCHGPSLKHVQAMRKGQPYEKAVIDPPVDFTKVTAQQFLAICSQCHMQSAVRSAGPDGELNYSRHGVFFMRDKSRPYDEFSRKGFYKDGRFRQTTFIVESLLRTECYKKGNVTCGSCHDPHLPDAASNPVSLKFRGHPDEMCLQCHVEYRAPAARFRHTHHPDDSEAGRCVSCHMPRIVDALLFEARSHEFDQIPDAGVTLRFGQKDSPNACLLCHKEKDAAWVKQQLMAWTASRAAQLAKDAPARGERQ